jgi:hypothetical protein
MKIAIFYHICQINLSAFIYQQQLHRLYVSGLIESSDYIHFGVNGDQDLFNVPDKTVIKYNQNWSNESDTLISLKEFCDRHSEYKVLYFHTKGISRPTLSINSWRLLLEYFTIDKWKDCVDALSSYNTAGCSLSSTNPPHSFIGNFWWANSSYIQTIDTDLLYSDERNDREHWISTGNDFNPKVFHDLKVQNNSLYWDIYSESNYIK